jgi:CelD/BcsL family acetyltransferase involved in cellulose biosynthesis
MTQVDEITTLDALERLGPEWLELWQRCPAATPFQSPEWLLPWWRHFSPGTLWVLVVREGQHLQGLAPLFIQCTAAGARHLSFIGCGVSDYLDVLADPSSKVEVVREMLTYLARRQTEWDTCELGDLPSESPLLEASPSDQLLSEFCSGETCTFVPLPDSLEDYERTLPWHLRRDLRSGWNRLSQAGHPRFDQPGTAIVHETMDALFRLHQSRWNHRRLPGVLGDQALQDFHREVASGMLVQERLRLYSLTLDGEPVAVFYGFACRGRLYFYLSGFEPRLKRVSLGSLILKYAVEQAIGTGLRELDFLRGTEPYKFAWGAKERCTKRLLLVKKSPAHRNAVPARAAAWRSISSLPTNTVS